MSRQIRVGEVDKIREYIITANKMDSIFKCSIKVIIL